MSAIDAIHADFPPSREWAADWIWADREDAENAYYYFRAEVTVDEFDDAELHITADTRYKLYVDGAPVGQGPPQSQPYYKYYDTRDVSSHLEPGENCVAVVVNYTGTMTDTRPGLLAELTVDGETVLGTDETWRVQPATAWRRDTFATHFNAVTPYQEHYDAREAPEGWTEPGFDDGDWERATVVTGGRWSDDGDDPPPGVLPWSYLLPRDIPYMETFRRRPAAIEAVHESIHLANRTRGEDRSITLSQSGTPIEHARVENADGLRDAEGVTVVQNSTNHLDDHTFDGVYDPCIVLDFGRVITGRIELELDGPAGGAVDIGYAERLIDGEFNNAIEGQFADRYVLCGDAAGETFRSFTWKGFRYVKLRFEDCVEPVTVEDVTAVVTRYPFAERGGFDSDDETLNDVFDMSRYTLWLCSHEQLMDTPWREQAQWLGDVSAVTLGGIYSCFGDVDLPAKFLRQSGANQQVTGLLANVTNDVSHDWQGALPDYSLWWVIALWEHYRYTGEEHWLHTFYPHVQKIVQALLRYRDEHGLLANVPFWPIMDWADLDRRGEFAPLNALFYGALDAVREIAAFKGDDHTADLAAEVRSGIGAAFETRFYDPDRGCFVDANVGGERSEHVSEHGNAAALHFGLADDGVAETVIATLYEDDGVDYVEAQPFFTSVVLQALDGAGRFDLALDLLRERWGERMVDRGVSSTFEEWGQNGSWRDGEYQGFMRTRSHAWSAHPAEFLIRNLAGFEIREPGCAAVALDPKSAGFEYEVAIPTPRGTIEVEHRDGDVDVSIPDDIRRIG